MTERNARSWAAFVDKVGGILGKFIDWTLFIKKKQQTMDNLNFWTDTLAKSKV